MLAYSTKTALLGNLVDYAGTFPPAALPLDGAMKEACAFRRQAKHPWLMAKMVVTIEDLKKLSPRAWFEAGADGTPFPLTVIGSTPEKAADLPRILGFELREVRHFNSKFVDSSLRQHVFGYETKLPESCEATEIEPLLQESLNGALNEGGLGVDVFFEIAWTGEWQKRLAQATKTLAEWAEDNKGFGSPGMKVRTGGKTPPSTDQLAQAVVACISHGLKFKATQGLHHAMSGIDGFGFVNLFAALAFAGGLGLEAFQPKTIEACLNETKAGAFRFGKEALEWGGHRLAIEQLEAARRRHAGTFGSCSIAEPDTFLAQELGTDL